MVAYVEACGHRDVLEWEVRSIMEDVPKTTSFRSDGGWGDERRKLMKFTFDGNEAKSQQGRVLAVN